MVILEVGPFNKHVVIKWTPCPVASGTILVDRPAEATLGAGYTPQDTTEYIQISTTIISKPFRISTRVTCVQPSYWLESRFCQDLSYTINFQLAFSQCHLTMQ